MDKIFSSISEQVAKDFEEPQVRDQMLAGLRRMYEEPMKLFPSAVSEDACRRALFVPTPSDITTYVFSTRTKEKSEISRRAKLMSLLYTLHSKQDALFRVFIENGGFQSLVLFINDENPYLRAQAVELLKSAVTGQKELKITRDTLGDYILNSGVLEEISSRIETQFEGDGPFFGEAIVSLLFACIIFLREHFQAKVVLGECLTKLLRSVTDPKDPLMMDFGTAEYPGRPSDAIKAQVENMRLVSVVEEVPDDGDAWTSEIRLIGNAWFKRGDFQAAKDIYTVALDNSGVISDSLRGVLLWNRCLCNQKLGHTDEAMKDAMAGQSINEKCSDFLAKFKAP